METRYVFFHCVMGSKRQEMEYAAAARWLLYVNAYDDTSAKPKGKGLPSPGVGWPGKLGLIAAVGDNLFPDTHVKSYPFKRREKSLGGRGQADMGAGTI